MDEKARILKSEEEDQGLVKAPTDLSSRIGYLKSYVLAEEFRQELRMTVRLSVPLVVASLCGIIVQPISLLFAGRLGVQELNALALANSLISVLGNSICLGMATASNTYFSQAMGSKNMRLVGTVLQRSIVLFMLVTVILWAIHLNAGGLLVLLGQDVGTALLTGQYLTLFLPGIALIFLARIFTCYLVNLGILMPGIWASVFALIVGVFCNWAFIYALNGGLDGSALAQVAGYLVTFAVLAVYTYGSGAYRSTYFGLTWRLFEDWGPFFSMAVNGLFMTCLELWAFEISIILSGILGETELGAQSIVFNLDLVCYPIPVAINMAISVRVGIAVGQGSAYKARLAGNVGFLVLLVTSIFTTTFLAALRFVLPYLFTQDEAVASLASNLLPYVAYYNVFVNLSAAGKGILRGCGKQSTAAVIIFIGYYVLALPIGVPLMFLTQLRTAGIWLGFSIALTFDALILIIYVVYFLDFDRMCEEAARRTGSMKRGNIQNSTKEPDEENQQLLKKTVSVEESAEGSPPLAEDEPMPRPLLVKRGLTILAVGLVFGVGVICRLLTKIDQDQDSETSEWRGNYFIWTWIKNNNNFTQARDVNSTVGWNRWSWGSGII